MMQQHTLLPDHDNAAPADERYRIGYSSDLFDVLESFGLTRGANILDAGCGAGASSEPLSARGMTITGLDESVELLATAKVRVPQATFVAGRVEALPFADGSFDGAICAQAFHCFESDKAFAELIRVVKPGGPIAVWWRLLGSDEPMREVRAAAALQAAVEPSVDPLKGGFSAFYRAPFASRNLRVIPFVARFSVDEWLDCERASAGNGYGEKKSSYLDALRTELGLKYGSPGARIEVRYTQFLYLARST